MMTFEKLKSVTIASPAAIVGATLARFARKDVAIAPQRAAALPAHAYVDLLSDELDRQTLTKAEQQDCASLDRIRSAIYSD